MNYFPYLVRINVIQIETTVFYSSPSAIPSESASELSFGSRGKASDESSTPSPSSSVSVALSVPSPSFKKHLFF